MMLLHLADRDAIGKTRRRDSVVARPCTIIPPDAFRRFSRDSSLAAVENFQTTHRPNSSPGIRASVFPAREASSSVDLSLC